MVVHPVFSDGIARTDRHKVPVTPYCPPGVYARITPALQHVTIHPFGASIWPGIEDHHPDPLPESSQESAIRAWKRVRIQDFAFAPRVISRYSKKPLVDMAPARCMAMWGGSPDGNGLSMHAAPDADCTCGHYGWKERDYEDRQQPSPTNLADDWAQPWAQVDFYGTVIEHEWGYRAERQRVMAIHVNVPAPTTNLSDLARAIGIPIIDSSGTEWK